MIENTNRGKKRMENQLTFWEQTFTENVCGGVRINIETLCDPGTQIVHSN